MRCCTAQAVAKYRAMFADGVTNYIQGDWAAAANSFGKCCAQLKEDEPPKFLLGYMWRFNCECPEDWPGYRALTEK